MAGRIFASGLEALKLPGDFGFDLLVSNQFELLRHSRGIQPSTVRQAPFPYAVQVKSRRAGDLQLNASNRYEVAIDFFISEIDFAKIVGNASAFLVCVGFLSHLPGELSGRPLIFWADGKWLKQAIGSGFLLRTVINGTPFLKLKLIYRSKAVQSAEGVLEGLSAEMLQAVSDKLDEASLSKAKAVFKKITEDKAKSLSETLPVGHDTNEYLSLQRPKLDFKNGCAFNDAEAVTIKLPAALLDLKNLGCVCKFEEFDGTGKSFIDTFGEGKFVSTKVNEVGT